MPHPRVRRRAPRRLIVVGLAVALCAPLGAGAARPIAVPDTALCHDGDPTKISKVKPGPYHLRSQQIVNLASAYDGATIHMGLLRPSVPAGKRVPVIVFASPYFTGSMAGDPVLNDKGHDLVKCVPRLAQNYVSHGYAIGYVAVRGTSDSGGCMDLFGKAERADLNQAVTWFGSRSWSNARVGMIGVSYDGSTPWEVAATGNKYLKTIVPISGVNDAYQLMYRNGAPEQRGAELLNALYYTYGFQVNNPSNGRSPQHTVDGVACPESFKGFGAAAYSFMTGERDPLGFWAERNSRPGVEKNYKGSIFLVHGLQDWNVDPGHDVPWVASLDRAGFTVKYLFSQGDHMWPDTQNAPYLDNGPSARWDWATVLLHWWDRWLKNDRTVDTGPTVQVQDSSGSWRNATAWPPSGSKTKTLYLSPSGTMSATPTTATGESAVGADPLRIAGNSSPARACPQCAMFTQGPLSSTLRFAGVPKVDLTVVPSAPNGFVSAWLFKQNRDGAYTRLGWGMVDLRFPHGGEKASMVTPGMPMRVRIPIEPLDAVVRAKEKLILVVSQGGFGGGDHMPSSAPAPLLLETGGRSSSVTMSTFSVGSGSFFSPPE